MEWEKRIEKDEYMNRFTYIKRLGSEMINNLKEKE